jgi:Kef-type K+ transport system membrane component KefB
VTFAQLALICAVALLGPMLSLERWLHLPVVIGELAVGVLLGATGLKVLTAADPTFGFLAEAGFALVMFVAGSHVPVRDPALRSGLRVGVARNLAIAALSVAVGLLVAAVFGTGHGLLYAVIMTSSSASLIMPALSGLPLTAPAIVAMLPQIALADAACIVALPLAIDPSNAARAAVGAVAVGAAAVLVWLTLRWLDRSGRRKAVHIVSEERELAIELRALLAVLFALAALATALHVSVMLAGFALGLAVSAVGEPRRVAKQLFALTEGFFAPIFFVWLGASLNLRDLAAHPAAVGLGLTLGLGALLTHAAMAVNGQPLPVAMVTAAQLGVPVAAATVGTTLGLLRDGEPTALLLGALVTIAATAFLSGPLARIARGGAKTPPPADSTAAGGG